MHPGEAQKKTNELVAVLTEKIPDLEAALPECARGDVNMVRTIESLRIMAMRGDTQALEKCSVQSIVMSVYDAMRMGIDPSNPLKHGYLVPFGTKCTFMLGYKGMLHLARRAGSIIDGGAKVVWADEEPHVVLDEANGIIEHRFRWDVDRSDPANIIGAYAYARLPNGILKVAPMDRSELDYVARMSKSGKFRSEWPERMFRKDAIRRLFNSGEVPLAREVMDSVAIDYENDKAIQVIENPPTSRADQIHAQLGLEKAEDAPQEPIAEPPPDETMGTQMLVGDITIQLKEQGTDIGFICASTECAYHGDDLAKYSDNELRAILDELELRAGV